MTELFESRAQRGETQQGPANVDKAAGALPLPSDALVILPVRNFVLFPGVVMPVSIGRARSVAAAQQAIREQRPIGILMQRDPTTEDPLPLDLHRMGTIANVARYITAPDGGHHLICQGDQRFQIVEFLDGWPFLVARVVHIPEPHPSGPEVEARFLHLQSQAVEAIELLPQAPPELLAAIQSVTSPAELADLTTAYTDMKPEEKQEILETIDVVARMEKVSRFLAQRIEVLRLSAEIGRQTKAALDERQREVLLREQMAAIQRQLGEGEEGRAAEVKELSEAITKAGMPKEVEEAARKELRRFQRMPEAAAEAGMVRTYLDWLIELPWTLPEETPIDIVEARRILDEDHFGLDKIKRRMVEFLAVRKLAPHGKAPILCFVGPPGVGKTSLGQSIARAMNRKFVRVSLGGMHDEAEIRGHRRTYIGALPGNIIQAIRKAGARNCVMMLDEIDKLGAGFQGDPSSALLEVLDPEQNKSFADHYLEVPFDLSKVLFIATANTLETVPAPLRDRMEILQIPSYTLEEKAAIARAHLLPKQLEAHGLADARVELTDAALDHVIHAHTREAGVRSLEKRLADVCRALAVEKAAGTLVEPRKVDVDELEPILGPDRFQPEVRDDAGVPGVAAGLAWTPVGGEVLYVEALRMPGKGQLILSGQLGDVMKESARAALSYVQANAAQLGVAEKPLEGWDVHVHVPAGATPKDGPSAGVTLFTALVSLLSGVPVRTDTAMTGEATLRGRVLPVGGIKEKVLAAHRLGLKRVVIPEACAAELREVPQRVRDELEIVLVKRMDEVLNAALDRPAADLRVAA